MCRRLLILAVLLCYAIAVIISMSAGAPTIAAQGEGPPHTGASDELSAFLGELNQNGSCRLADSGFLAETDRDPSGVNARNLPGASYANSREMFLAALPSALEGTAGEGISYDTVGAITYPASSDPWNIRAAEEKDGYVYVLTRDGELLTYNVSGLRNEGYTVYDKPTAKLKLQTSGGGLLRNGDYLYVYGWGGLLTLDIKSPGKPRLLHSQYQLVIYSLARHNNYLIAGGRGRLGVYTTDNPAQPRFISDLDLGYEHFGFSVVAHANRIYVGELAFADGTSWFRVVDFSRPSSLSTIRLIDLQGSGLAYHLFIHDNKLIECGTSFVALRDLSNPDSPQVEASQSAGARACVLQGDNLVAEGSVFKISGNQLQPVDAFEPVSCTIDGFPYGAVATGENVFMAGSQGITIVATRKTTELGFRREVDGFQFANYSGFEEGDFGDEELRELFGDDSVCVSRIKGECIVNPAASLWRRFSAVPNLQGGKCDGFASTSLLLYRRLGSDQRNDPSDFERGASRTFDVDRPFIRDYIAVNFLKQLLSPVSQVKSASIRNSPSAIVKEVIRALEQGKNPPTLFIRSGQGSGHALVPMSVESRGHGRYRIYVYDNNHPHPQPNDRFVVIDSAAESWEYDHKNSIGVWRGDKSTRTMGIVPVSSYAERPRCPWCVFQSTNTEDDEPEQVEINAAGDGNLLVIDADGRRTGFVGGSFLNEIPGAEPAWLDDGTGLTRDPVYHLPAEGAYEVYLDGSTRTDLGSTGVARFGSSYSAVIDNVDLSAATGNSVVFAADSGVTFKADEEQEIDMRLAVQTASADYLVEVLNHDLSTADEVELYFDDTLDQLTVSHAASGTSVYTLQMTRVVAAGESKFVHKDVAVAGGDTQIIDLTSWKESGITICTDFGSTGVIDDCHDLANDLGPHGGTTFLPFVVRQSP